MSGYEMINMNIVQIYTRGESQAATTVPPAVWFWSSQLHWDEVCSTGDKDSPHGAA